jgi:hypothetical protein
MENAVAEVGGECMGNAEASPPAISAAAAAAARRRRKYGTRRATIIPSRARAPTTTPATIPPVDDAMAKVMLLAKNKSYEVEQHDEIGIEYARKAGGQSNVVR